METGQSIGLFQIGSFKLHSGERSFWKIDCDALTDKEIRAIVAIMLSRIPSFGRVEGVPKGGLRLAEALKVFSLGESLPLLIVDDVITTGNSMEKQRAGRTAIGVVIFSRTSVYPSWIHPLFVMPEIP